MKIIDSILTDAASIAAIRKDIHAHPELCFQEVRTADVVAKQLTDQGLAKKGHKVDEKTLRRELDRYIPTAAMFGGMCIGALTVFTDMIGALEKGTSILLATNMIYSLFESYDKEAQMAMMGY